MNQRKEKRFLKEHRKYQSKCWFYPDKIKAVFLFLHYSQWQEDGNYAWDREWFEQWGGHILTRLLAKRSIWRLQFSQQVLKGVWALIIRFLENHLLDCSSSADLCHFRERFFTSLSSKPLEVSDSLWLSMDLEYVLVFSPAPLKLEHLVGERHICTLKPPTLITKLPQQDPANEIKMRIERKIEPYCGSMDCIDFGSAPGNVCNTKQVALLCYSRRQRRLPWKRVT